MGSETLIIVESNGKCKKIEKFTGHKCVASFGHVFALKPTLKWFDPNNIEPEYIIHKGKEKIIKDLKVKANKATRVIIASDLDREGEAIAAHLMKLLKLNVKTTERITFNQISEKALKESLEKSGRLDVNLYHAQQARAVIDIVFGFMVSPFLSRHLNIRALSAGRCQSPAVRICMERQREQKVGEIGIKAISDSDKLKNISHIGPELSSKDIIIPWLEGLKTQRFKVVSVKVRDVKETPPPPFITSSLQQMAYNRYSYNPKKTMEIAQKLYEGGYITYMRTDSVSLSLQFQESAILWIKSEFGEEYACKRQYGKRGNMKTQDAHEAIRPINIQKDSPNDSEQYKLYELIKLRAIASQMSQAIYSESKIILETNHNEFEMDKWESLDKKLIFAGFNRLKGCIPSTNIEEEQIKSGDTLEIESVCVRESAATPKAPFNPAGFVKMLEKTGIGRPSTYSSIVERIQEKGYITIGTNPKLDLELLEWNMKMNDEGIEESKYVQKIGGQKNIFVVSDLGIRACEFMDKSPIEPIVNSSFTSKLEDKLDLVADGTLDWRSVVREFHSELSKKLALQPPPPVSGLKKINWVNILNESIDKGKIGIVRTQYGLCICKETNGNIVYSKMPPNSTKDDLELDEAENMFNYPLVLENNIEIRLGQYGWYVTNGQRSVSIGKDRNPPSIENALKAFEEAPKNSIIKQINKNWTLRKKNESYFLMYLKGKKPIFYPVSDINGEWTVKRCEEIQKKNKRRS